MRLDRFLGQRKTLGWPVVRAMLAAVPFYEARVVGACLASERERSSRQDPRVISNGSSNKVSGILPVGLADLSRAGPAPTSLQGRGHGVPGAARPRWRNGSSLYHQIKRLFGHFDNRVIALHRERIGAIRLDPSLAPGQYRALGADEIRLPGPAEPGTQEPHRP